VSNISAAPEFFGTETGVAAEPVVGGSAPGSAGGGTGATAGFSTLPWTVRGPAPSQAQPRRRTRRVRAIVVEPAGDTQPDRLDHELDVAARLPLPLSADRLAATLDEHRPTLLLCKHSLDSIDETVMAVCRAHGVEICVLAHPVYGAFRPLALRRFGGLPWLRLRRRSTDEFIKRVADLTLAVVTLPLTLPLMALIFLAVSLSGPAMYVQDRVGAGGRCFRMVKFRTMRVDAERETGPAYAALDDPRVTRLGRWLRRFRLDELPQLWNVLIGDMSLVGPRPERPEFVAALRNLPNYELRHLTRPGMTGIAQLTGGYAATPEEKLRCDLLYLHYRSLRSDLTLLVLTVTELLRGFPRG
jgi:lipopolysaccharide/colanic/teichoic acid biosynthesis glycosyltransferase